MTTSRLTTTRSARQDRVAAPTASSESQVASTNVEADLTALTALTAEEQRAVWSTAEQNDFPDSSFAYVEAGGAKDREGKTVPRDKRHLVYKDADGKPDAAHVRNALARLDETDIPAAAKASAYRKLAAAARELGIELSEESKPEGTSEGRAAQPTAQAPAPQLPANLPPEVAPAVARRLALVAEQQRAAAAAEGEITRLLLPGSVRVVDAARREFEICATSEAVDSFGTVFAYEASKDAFQRWLRVGNVREMHAPVAVGRGLEARFDDDARKTFVRGRISRGADSTWLKLEDGVLQGASIGASNVTWEDRVIDGRRVPVATRYDLVELSLVDNPSNPDALGVSLIRSAEPNTLLLEGARIVDADSVAPSAAANQFSDAQRAALFPETAAVGLESQASSAAASSAAPTVGVVASAAPEAAPSAELVAAASGVSSVLSSAGEAAQEHRRSAWRMQQDEINRRRELQAEITRAGDEAIADIPPLQRGEDAGAYAARIANIRGAAEAHALVAQKARLWSEALTQAPQVASQAASQDTQGADEARARHSAQASVASSAQPSSDAKMRKDDDLGVSATGAAAGGIQNGAVTGIVQTGPTGGDATEDATEDATDAAPAAELGGPAIGAQATARDEEHEHEHEHVNADGSRLRHAHPHTHDTPGHDHLHTYRNGAPIDTRLATAATTTRAPLPQNGKETDIPDRAVRHPVSGAAQQPLREAQSAMMSMQPSKVGHMVLANTQDVEAVDFGVPAEADGRAEGDDELTLNPADFHEGGHGSSVGNLAGAADEHAGVGAPVASRPPEPTRPAIAARPTTSNPSGGAQSAGMVRTASGASAGVTRAMAGRDDGRDELTATSSQPLAGAEPGLSQQPNAAIQYTTDVPGVSAQTTSPEMGSVTDDDTQPGYAEAEGEDSDADDARTPSRPPAPTPIARAQQGVPQPAQEQRVGARLSASSREAVHQMRDTAMQSVKMAAQHCGCPDCAGILAIVNGGMLDAQGQHPQPGDEQADVKSDTAMFGELRAVRAEFARRFTTLQAELAATLDQLGAELRTQLADAQLTLSDHQRGYAAQTQRSVTTAFGEQITRSLATLSQTVATNVTDRLTRMPDELATRAAAVVSEAVSSRLGELTETVSAVKEGVERIERQPIAPIAQPVAGLVDKRVALSPGAAQDPRMGSMSPEAEIAYLQRMAAETPAADTALRTQIATRITQLTNPGRR